LDDSRFFGREKELSRLQAFLAGALAGQGQVGFVAGEPGAGKSTLLVEFARRAQASQHNLLVAQGSCNAHTGAGEPYLPFREVLGTLVGGLQTKPAKGAVAITNTQRVNQVMARSALLILEVAPQLVDTFLPTFNLASILGSALLDQSGLKEKLEQVIKSKSARPELAKTALSQENIFEQYTQFLLKLSAEAPLLLVLDDIQWADASSLDLLFHLARRIEKSRILILCAYRPDEVAIGRAGERHPLEKVQAELKRFFGDITIHLDPKATSADCAFIDTFLDAEPNRLSGAFRSQLCRRTQGNPLFVRELLRDMQERQAIIKDSEGYWVESQSLDWDTLPARVQGVIEERTNRLEPGLRESLSYASVQGEEFIAEVTARMRRVTDREMVQEMSNELSKRHQLVEASGMQRLGAQRLSLYRFQHYLIQTYLYQRLDEIERSYLHEEAARLLEEFYAGQLDAMVAKLAWHFSEAGLAEKAAHYLLRAGELAANAYANTEALQYFNRGLESLPEQDLETRLRLLLAREAVYSRLGLRPEQTTDLDEMLRLAKAMGSARPLAEVRLRQAIFALDTGDYESAQQSAQDVISLGDQVADMALEAQGYAILGRVLYHRSEYEEARQWLALVLESEAADTALRARVVYDLGLADYGQDHYEAALGRFSEAQQIYQDLSDGKGQVNCLLMIGTIASQRGDPLQTIPVLEQALVLCRRVGWRRGETYILGNLGSVRLDLGDLEGARQDHEQALAICREVGDREGEAISLDTLGMVQHRLGNLVTARDSFQKALDIDRAIGYRRGEGFALTHFGYTLADLGELDAAEAALNQALEIRRQLDRNSGTAIDDVAGLARIAQARGQWERAVQLASEALDWMATNDPARLEYPVQVYWICSQILLANTAHRPDLGRRGQKALASGHSILTDQAGRLLDENYRKMFLERVPFNRDLLAAWQAEASTQAKHPSPPLI